MVRACYVTVSSWEPFLFTSPLAPASLGDESLSRHRELSGAWLYELFTLPFALGSLSDKSLSRHYELSGAVVLRAVYATVRSWESWC